MATLTIRNLDDEVHAALRVRAAHHGRSMEEEVRQLLSAAIREGSTGGREDKAQAALERMRAAMKASNGGVLPAGVVDELLAERRSEAEREQREAKGTADLP